MSRLEDLTGGIPDLGALRARQQDEEAPALPMMPGAAIYANDVEVGLDPSGTVTAKFFYRDNNGMTAPTIISMPVGVFMEMAGIAPAVNEALAQATARMQQAMSAGGAPSSIEEAMRARDGAS